MKKNPMFEDDFVFSSMDCAPLVPQVLEALGMYHEVGESLWGEGGMAAYEMCFNVDGHDEVFIFSDTGMTQEKWADRLLRWAVVGRDAHLFVTAPAFSKSFMFDLMRRRHAPVHFVLAQDGNEPFRQTTVVEGGPSLDKKICPECHLDADFHPGRGILMCPEGTRRMNYEAFAKRLRDARKDGDPEEIAHLEHAVEWFDPYMPNPEDLTEDLPDDLSEVEDLLESMKPKEEDR